MGPRHSGPGLPLNIDECQYACMPNSLMVLSPADRAGAFDLSQPTISHHLKVLHDAGLLDRDKRGVWVYYRARTGALASLGALIGSPSRDQR
jgi:DNA-binding transcriptional ArsR family regulator